MGKIQKIQQTHQKHLQHLSTVVTDLAAQMQSWILEQQTRRRFEQEKEIAMERLRGNNYQTKTNVNDKRSKSRPRSTKGRNTQAQIRSRREGSSSPGRRVTEVIPITKSLSPESRGLKKGEEFMQRIEDLRKDLEIQGNSLNLMQSELTGAEARFTALQGN